MDQGYRLILGSGSPRRKELLNELGFQFEVRISDTDESAPPHLSPEETVEWVAKSKAQALMPTLGDEELLLTADTEVWQENRRFGKPSDKVDAIQMLEQLSATKHKVISGFCLASRDSVQTYHVSTTVFFRSLSVEQIEHYVNVYQPLDKAGAYGIQEWIGMTGIERIEGSYFNVVGLPTAEVWQALKSWPNRAPNL